MKVVRTVDLKVGLTAYLLVETRVGQRVATKGEKTVVS